MYRYTFSKKTFDANWQGYQIDPAFFVGGREVTDYMADNEYWSCQ